MDTLSFLKDLSRPTGTIFTGGFEIAESAIDFPREDLPKDLWDKDGETYKLKPEVKNTLMKAVEACDVVDLKGLAKEIHLIGSIGTNQWLEDTDIDIHVIPDESKGADVGLQKQIKDWYDEHREQFKVGKHGIEVYLQLNPTQEFVGDAVYDLETDKWIKGPGKVSQDFNPYDEYKDIIDTIGSVVGGVDQILGDIKRDVIDYDVIKKAISDMPKETKEKLRGALEAKLKDIEAGIDDLMKEKKEWVDLRSKLSSPATPEQALEDVEYIKKWQDENALFKFLNRYQYLRLIRDLKDMMDEGDGIDHEDVEKIKDMLGVMNTKGADDV